MSTVAWRNMHERYPRKGLLRAVRLSVRLSVTMRTSPTPDARSVRKLCVQDGPIPVDVYLRNRPNRPMHGRKKGGKFKFLSIQCVLGMVRIVFWRVGNGAKSVLAWRGWREKCFGVAGMTRDGQGMRGEKGGKFKFLSV